MQITLFAKSSSGNEPYRVDFIQEDGLLSVRCNCAAGVWGQLCKHKTQLLANDDDMLYDPNQREPLNQVAEWVANSQYQKVLAELRESEEDIERAKRKYKAMKIKLATIITEGM